MRKAMINTNKKRNLDEVSLIRPILIVLLVLYHAFAHGVVLGNHLKGLKIIRYIGGLVSLHIALCFQHFVLSPAMYGHFKENLWEKKKISKN